MLAHDETPPTTSGSPAGTHAVDNAPHPQLSADANWAGAMVIGFVVLLFVAAAVIGPIVAALAPPAAPPAAHDEAPAHH